jgi:hypothetical protein
LQPLHYPHHLLPLKLELLPAALQSAWTAHQVQLYPLLDTLASASPSIDYYSSLFFSSNLIPADQAIASNLARTHAGLFLHHSELPIAVDTCHHVLWGNPQSHSSSS